MAAKSCYSSEEIPSSSADPLETFAADPGGASFNKEDFQGVLQTKEIFYKVQSFYSCSHRGTAVPQQEQPLVTQTL